MTLVTMPTVGIKSAEWTPPERAAFIVESGWTGAQTVGDLGGNRSGWQAKVTVRARKLAEELVWRAFFASLLGPVNTFGLKAVEKPQTTLLANIYTASVGASTLQLNVQNAGGSTFAGGLVIPAGSLLQIAPTLAHWEVFTALADVTSDGFGHATVLLDSPMRYAYAATNSVFIANPMVQMRLAGPRPGWVAVPGYYSEITFDCEEAIG